MGNLVQTGQTLTVEQKGKAFIIRHKDEWKQIINDVKLARYNSLQGFLDKANAIYAPLIEADGYGVDVDVEVARWLWRKIKSLTEPPVKEEEDDLPL